MMQIRRIVAASAVLFAVCATVLAGPVEKGEPAAPPNAEAVVGNYYCGDGLGYNITLSLEGDGTYTAERSGCVGKYGEASGKWTLIGSKIFLTPHDEKNQMRGHLRTLDVLAYKDAYIFVPADKRGGYDKHGVSRHTCFQRREK